MRLMRCIQSFVPAMAAFAAWGCESGGMTYRESPWNNQGTYLAALQADGGTIKVGAPQRFRAPANIAVAQLGEVAPPQALIDRLRHAPSLFQRVQAIPATF